MNILDVHKLTCNPSDFPRSILNMIFKMPRIFLFPLYYYRYAIVIFIIFFLDYYHVNFYEFP